MKICTSCKLPKPEVEGFYKHKRMVDGYSSSCKECTNEVQRAYKATHQKEIQARAKSYYQKNRIKITRRVNIRYHADLASGRAYNLALYQKHREKRLASVKAYRETHLEQTRNTHKRYYQTHKEAFLKNASLYHQQHPEQVKRTRKKWVKTHPDRVRDIRKRRYAIAGGAKVKQLVCTLDICIRDQWRCHICGKKVARKDVTLDHLIPISAGGAHLPENVSLAHRVCNSRRGAGRLPAQLLLLGS
jgi:5-methylcytosine-specific restriction endonuclease McrA